MTDVLTSFWTQRMHSVYARRTEVSKLQKTAQKQRKLHRLIVKSEKQIVVLTKYSKRYAVKLREERCSLLRKIRKNHKSIDNLNRDVLRHTSEVSALIKVKETLHSHINELKLCRKTLLTTSRNFRLLADKLLIEDCPLFAADCVKAEQECMEVLLNVNLEHNGSRAKLDENLTSIEKHILAWGQLDIKTLQAERQNAEMGGRLWSLKREYANCEAHVSFLHQQVYTVPNCTPILPFFSPILYDTCCFRSMKLKKRVSGPKTRSSPQKTLCCRPPPNFKYKKVR